MADSSRVSIERVAQRQEWKVFCFLALFFASIAVCAQPAMQIPATEGTTLAGSHIALPDAFKGKINIIVVGFSRGSQEQVGSWGRLLAADYGHSGEVDYFEVAMLGTTPKLLRSMIIKRLSSSVPFDQRPHYFPVLESDQAWRAVAHYDKPDDAYILLVDGKGTVLWQTQGEPTNSAYGTFKATLAKLLKSQLGQGSAQHSTAAH